MNSQVRFCSILLVEIDYTDDRVRSKETQKSRCGDKSKHENQIHMFQYSERCMRYEYTQNFNWSVFLRKLNRRKFYIETAFNDHRLLLLSFGHYFPYKPVNYNVLITKSKAFGAVDKFGDYENWWASPINFIMRVLIALRIRSILWIHESKSSYRDKC